MSITVLGVYTGHDQAACLLRDGRVAVMVEEERLTRAKHGLPKRVRGLWHEFNGRFGYFPWASLAYCLEAEGLGLDDLDLLVLPADALDYPMASLLPLRDRSKVWVADEPAGGMHHFAHALSAFCASGFERAAVLVVDGDGTVTPQGYEAESGYRFHDREGRCEEVFKNRYPMSGLRCGLGWLYDYVSAILGFVETRVGYLSQPGKTMGLAPYGGPNPGLAAPWVARQGTTLDFSGFHEWLVGAGHEGRLRFDDRSQALIQREDAISREAADLAWKAQHELEGALVGLAAELHARTGERALCIAGGVALNSVANALIRARTPFEQVFIQPAAHDGGQALGLAYQGHLRVARARGVSAATPPMRTAALGRSYPEEQVRELLRRAGLPVRQLPDDAGLARDAAAALARGQFVGWFQGGSEVGPRALGHRSILADPRGAETKDHLNARVKFREAFRPFAPSVLAERAAEVFEVAGESPFMLLVEPVRPEWRERVPAITHVDGTARLQTVDAAAEPLYHALISEFARRTGVPLVLNTSFNLRGMPIVETPFDALRCFLFTSLDALYLGRLAVARPDPDLLVPRAAPGWRLVIEHSVAGKQTWMNARYERGEGEDAERVSLRPIPELVELCSLFDGERTLGAAIRQVAREPDPPAEIVRGLTTFVQQMLRAGALSLQVGELTLTKDYHPNPGT
ncbi:MAG: carbamoyltransferase [Planctomycetota bacterium]